MELDGNEQLLEEDSVSATRKSQEFMDERIGQGHLQDASVTMETAGMPITTDFLFNSLVSQDKKEIRFDLTSSL